MKKNKILIVANWKMHPENNEKAKDLFLATKKVTKNLKNIQVVVCPPFIYLQALEKVADKSIFLGAQNVFTENSGSFTGEVSPSMLKYEGENYVIIGHSERRELGETDEFISQKVLAALKNHLWVILCIGEKERDSHGEYLMFLRNQIVGSLNKVSRRYMKNLIIAYEPVWAIGQSEDKAMKPNDVHETSIFIKKVLAEIYGQKSAVEIPILYGGAVTEKNAKDLLILGEVQGLLVGHESLHPEKFKKLLRSIPTTK